MSKYKYTIRCQFRDHDGNKVYADPDDIYTSDKAARQALKDIRTTFEKLGMTITGNARSFLAYLVFDPFGMSKYVETYCCIVRELNDGRKE